MTNIKRYKIFLEKLGEKNMKVKSLTLILGMICSTVINLYVLWVLKELENYYLFGLVLSLLIFSLIILHSVRKFSLLFIYVNLGGNTIWIIWALAELVVILVKPPYLLTQFIPWNELPIQAWLRLVAVFLLTTFYPGFGLIKLLIRKKKLSLLETIMFSFLISIFTASIISFLAIVFCNSLQIAFYIVLIVNMVLLSSTVYLRKTTFKKRGREQALRLEFSDFLRALILGSIIIFVYLSVYLVNFPDKFVPTIDQWYHYGQVLEVLNGNFFNFVHSYYFYYMYPSLFIYSSGMPFLNAYMALFLLIPLPILSFYLMTSKFLNENRRIVATLVYAFFSGFGGIYADYLRFFEKKDINSAVFLASAKAYDIFSTVSFSFYLFPKIFSFSAFFILIYLIYDSDISGLSKSILWAIIFAEGFLLHEVEIYFIFLLLTFLILLFENDILHIKEIFVGNILAFIIIAAIDLASPQKLYIFSYLWEGRVLPEQLAFIAMIIGVPLLYYSGIRLSFIKRTSSCVMKKLFLLVLLTVFYILCLGIIIWISVLPSFNIFSYGLLYSYFAWYLYPIKLGIASLLSLIGAYQLFRVNENKVLRFSYGVILISVGLERLMGYFRLMNMLELSFIDPARMLDFTWVGIAILASPVLEALLGQISSIDFTQRLTQREIIRKFSATCLLIMFIVAGFSSTLYSIELRSSTLALKVTKNELNAMDFLRVATPSNATILALGNSVNKINSFSGHYPVMYYQPAIFGASYFETFADIMKHNTYELYGHSPIRYFWLTSSDKQELESYKDGYFLNYVFKNLPIAYKSEDVTVFALPLFYPPSSNSDLVVVKSMSNDCLQNLFLTAIALAGLNYTVRYDFDMPFTVSTLVLPNSLDESVLKHLEVAKVQRIVVFNIDGSLDRFAHLLHIKIDPSMKQIVNGIKVSNIEISSPPIEVPLFYSIDRNTEVLAFYTRNGQPTSPYVFKKMINNREIIYVMLYPYLQALCNNMGNELGINIFTNLGALIKVLNLQSTSYQSSKAWGRAIIFGSTILEGDIVIQPLSFYIPALVYTRARRALNTSWVEDIFYSGWSAMVSNPKRGSINIESTGDILTVSFEVNEKNVWEYFFLKTPRINVSQTPFLVVREMIEASDFNLGFLRIVAGSYTYDVRGWDPDTTPPGHMWKTYVFDLTKATPKQSDAPVPIKAPITAIYWTGYSTEKSGRAKLYIDYIAFTNSPSDLINLINYNKTFANLNLTEAQSILINGVSTVEETLNNVQILDFHILGDVNVTFLSKKAMLLPPGLGTYSKIVFPEGCTIVFSLSNSSQINFTILRDAKPVNVTVTGGKVYLNLFSIKGGLEIYMNNPQIEVNGSALFEKAFISWPYKIYNPGLSMNASGKIRYKVNAMDNSFSLISEFDIQGRYKIITQSQIRWNEWDIPWPTVITSPYHSLLIGVIIVLYYAYLKKRMFNSSKDLI